MKLFEKINEDGIRSSIDIFDRASIHFAESDAKGSRLNYDTTDEK